MIGRIEKSKSIINILIIIIAIISLMSTVTNYIPLSAIISGVIIILPYLLIVNKKIPQISIYLIIIFIYFAISVAIYDFKSLINYDFYRRDGNFFITFAPLLILSLTSCKFNTNKILDFFLKWVTIINTICMFYFLIFIRNREYCFLFFAHNAAGGYITTIISLLIGKLLVKKDKTTIIMLILNIIFLIITQSRGSIIGLIIGLFCLFFVYKDKFKNVDKILFIVCLMAIIVLSYIITGIIGEKVLLDDGQNYQMPVEFQNTSIDEILNILGRPHTIVNRVFYLWPRAVKLFIMSPICGIGFGAYNDIPYNLNVILNNVFTINENPNIIFGSSHAHNSYLHILAETGIIGFGLVVILLDKLKKIILSLKNTTLKYSLYLSFITIVFSAFTEHRLFTPSQVLPFTILLGLSIAEKNYKEKEEENKEKKLFFINGRFLTQNITGVQRYAIEVIKQLDKVVLDKEIIVLLPKKGDIFQKLEFKNIKIKRIGSLTGHLWEQISLPIYIIMLNRKADLISLCNLAPIIKPDYVVIHDISFKTHPEHLNKKFSMFYRIITRLNIKRYKHIYTVSNFSKNEIMDNYGIDTNKITVTYNSAEHLKNIKEDKRIIKDLSIKNKDFYFCLGSKSPHKNHKFVVNCAKQNPDSLFVISGNNNKVFKNQTEEEKIKNLVYTGYLSDKEIVSLYKNCKAFIFPSLYEGFGIPPLEAIQLGCKNIILSDIEVFNEIYGEYAHYLDTTSNKKVNLNEYSDINGIEDILKKYTWDNVAKKILDHLE